MTSLVRFALRLSLLSPRTLATSRTSSATINPGRRFITTKPFPQRVTHAIARPTTRPLPSSPIIQLLSRNASTIANASPTATTVSPAAKPSGKLRGLLRKYGATGVAVYLGIGAIDLGLTFLAIQTGGADSVKKVEDWMVDKFGRFGLFGGKYDENGSDSVNEMVAKSKRGEKPSAASILVLAYGIHKTILLPFRVGATAVVTPWLVRRLQGMGWVAKKVVGKV